MKCVRPGSVSGRVSAPASKSMMQRAVLAASLARGESCILNPSYSEDGRAALSVAVNLGASVSATGEQVQLIGGGYPRKGAVLHCGESGLCLRMTSAIAALFSDEVCLTGEGSLLSRPIDMIARPLESLGVYCKSNGGKLPLIIRGPLRGGQVEVDGSVSSQFLTGLLMALPLCESDSLITVPLLRSKPYIMMTLELLDAFGVRIDAAPDLSRFAVPGGQSYTPAVYAVEGDWSGASFLLVAAAIAGELEVTGLKEGSPQADKAIVTALKRAGADVRGEGESIHVRRAKLEAFEFDARECPDLFPPLVALAACCEGVSRIDGAERLAHKESDRGAALAEEFSKLGIAVEREGTSLAVRGGPMHGAEVNSHNDHRIAMACAVAALAAGGDVCIHGEESVSKSFPDFYDRLESVRRERESA